MMGHYDNCRDGYCPKCGAAPGNLIKGRCQFCEPTTDEENDPSGTLTEWLMYILFLIEVHGPDAVLYTDAGHNNVELKVSKS